MTTPCYLNALTGKGAVTVDDYLLLDVMRQSTFIDFEGMTVGVAIIILPPEEKSSLMLTYMLQIVNWLITYEII